MSAILNKTTEIEIPKFKFQFVLSIRTAPVENIPGKFWIVANNVNGTLEPFVSKIEIICSDDKKIKLHKQNKYKTKIEPVSKPIKLSVHFKMKNGKAEIEDTLQFSSSESTSIYEISSQLENELLLKIQKRNIV